MSTRGEWAAKGILFVGPPVPPWYKLQSDGCSLPLGKVGRFLLRGRRAKLVCCIHDFECFIADIQYERHSPAWRNERLAADFGLKINRKLLARCWLVGQMYARLYYRGVRLGSYSRVGNQKIIAPPTNKAIDDMIDLMTRPLSSKALAHVQSWRNAIEAGV